MTLADPPICLALVFPPHTHTAPLLFFFFFGHHKGIIVFPCGQKRQVKASFLQAGVKKLSVSSFSCKLKKKKAEQSKLGRLGKR